MKKCNKKIINIEYIEHEDGTSEIIKKHTNFKDLELISVLEVVKTILLKQLTENHK